MSSIATEINTQATNERWFVVIAVMLVAVIEVLDMTIVNIAMPQMMGSLSTNADQITWILTSYIVSSAVIMLLTGFLVDRIGRKRLLIINILGFLVSSVLCGLAQNLAEIVIFRTLQGLFGGSLVPLSQFILRDTFSRKEQGIAMAVWATGIMAAPVLGPTLGGYITETFNWRWVFYINIPVCIIAYLMTRRYIAETPIKNSQTDWVGLGAMMIGVGVLQIVLDRGNSEDWFQSSTILFLTFICVSSLSVFVYRGITHHQSSVNLRVFADRNFAITNILLVLYALSLFGVMAIQPLMLENLMGYNAVTAGTLLAPRGLISAVFMILTGSYLSRYDPRILITLGIILSAWGSYMMSSFNLDTSFASMLPSLLLQGAGMGLFFVPLSIIAYDTLPPTAVAQASGLFSFGRSLGNSIGISILSTVISREAQINWQNLGSHIQLTNVNLYYWLQHTGLQLQDPKTIAVLAKTLSKHAQMNAFLDSFWLATAIFIVMLPLVFFLQRIHSAPREAEVVH